ncbi:MAG: protein phosphatase 2C domain-containing protein [Chloroflexi bacterium]|nr:protein phosphatase 2C domain-containing protein [Chloroflexota bacterium]
MANTHISFGQAMDTGLDEKAQRADASTCIVSALNSHNSTTDCGIFAVAAGVGSKEGSNPQKAAAIAIQNVAAAYSGVYTTILADENSNTAKFSDSMLTMAQKANKAIQAFASKEKSSDQASLTAVMIFKNTAYLAHVGNTRAYMVNGKTVKQITHDQVKEDNKTLASALGQAADPEVECSSHPITPDTKFLLCSANLWNFISEEHILKYLTEEPYAQQACEKLVTFAKTNGAAEHVAAVVVYMPEA